MKNNKKKEKTIKKRKNEKNPGFINQFFLYRFAKN
jgi:hypothetical protein